MQTFAVVEQRIIMFGHVNEFVETYTTANELFDP